MNDHPLYCEALATFDALFDEALAAGEPDRVLYWAATFRSAGDDLIHHWHQQGDNADPGQVDWQTAEFAVHTWDLCRATGQAPRPAPPAAKA